MKQFIEAFLKAQKQMENAVKGSNNPYFKSKYADLNSVREACTSILNEHGIVILQPMITIDGNEYVQTILLHESGEKIESFTKILCKSPNDPQAYGSGVTYARRYGLQSLVSLGAEDDDGNNATKEPKAPTTQPVKPPTPKFLDVNVAIDEMEACQTRAETDTVWNKYVGLHKDVNFIESAKKMALKYPKTN